MSRGKIKNQQLLRKLSKMKLLSSLEIKHDTGSRFFELWEGDLTELTLDEAVDVLVVPACPDDYHPFPDTLIGGLDQKGISVKDLARDKLVDLRNTCSCWLSQPITTNIPGIQFKQILCFEPHKRGKPTEVVGDIFRSLIPFIYGNPPMTRVAMPLVSTGNAMVPVIEMMDALFSSDVNWLSQGLQINRLMLVERDKYKARELKGAFDILKKHYEQEKSGPVVKQYDVFISYSHKDIQDMEFLSMQLREMCPNLRLFIDRSELVPGIAWQQKLYQSIDISRKVLSLYSPDYLISKPCQEEFNLALVLHRKSASRVLFPLFIHEADLPQYISELQYIDCREGDLSKMMNACQELVKELAV
jgi:hypothetical protein